MNKLIDTNPELVNEWDRIKNDKYNEKKMELSEVTKSSTYPVVFYRFQTTAYQFLRSRLSK